MPEIPPEILHAAGMLDDEDENIGVNLLAYLVSRADELGDLPAQLQETSDPVVRRRIHQLQVALAMRQRRREFHSGIFSNECALIDGLEKLHLLWFDRDNAWELHESVSEFCREFRSAGITGLEDVAAFMWKKTFLPEAETTTVPENYCIGTVIDRNCGATSLLMALIVEFAGNSQWQPVKIMDEFAVYDGEKNILRGNGSWRVCQVQESVPVEFLDNVKILKYIAGTLLSCAVNSDSYRYVMSIAQAVSGDESEHVFDHFPYPFRTE